LQDFVDPGQHAVEILTNLQVGETKHFDAEALQVGCALLLVRHRLRGEVRAAIHLDGELRARRVKVGNVGIEAVLPSKRHAELFAS